MSRTAKGPRLYLRKGRRKGDGTALPDRYFIRDDKTEIGTGCGPDRFVEAQEQLAQYIVQKYANAVEPTQDARVRKSNPAAVYVAEVLAEYAAGPAQRLANPANEASLIETLLPFWQDMTLADVRRSTCEAYVAKRITEPHKSYKKDPASAPRVSDQTARRELECLGTAISKWHEEHHLSVVPKIVLPRKAETPRDALTRSQAARLLWAAMGWGLRDGKWVRLSKTTRSNRMHVRRFILMSIYTGSRAGVTCRALWNESPLHPWADIDSGVLYRRGRNEIDHRTKRRPVVAFPNRLLAHMRRWRRLDEAKGYQPVIHFGGKPIERVKTSFASCVADAGLSDEISPHWMRHTCATWLMEAGVDVWAAAGFLGMSPATLIKNYGHQRPDYQDDVRNRFG